MLLLYAGVLILLAALVHAIAESCRSTARSTVDPDSSSVDQSWSQGHVLPALGIYSWEWRSSRTRESVPNRASQGIRCLIWASCTYRQLGADVSTFHRVYASRNYKLAQGSSVSILPAVPVVRSSTCVCCLEDFRPCSTMAVLKCGHAFHRKCPLTFGVRAAIPQAGHMLMASVLTLRGRIIVRRFGRHGA